jgi:hypothetical protein
MNLHQILGDTFNLFLEYVFLIFKKLTQLTMHLNMGEV